MSITYYGEFIYVNSYTPLNILNGTKLFNQPIEISCIQNSRKCNK